MSVILGDVVPSLARRRRSAVSREANTLLNYERTAISSFEHYFALFGSKARSGQELTGWPGFACKIALLRLRNRAF